MNGYILLGIAITFEVFSTSMLKASAGFTKLIPSFAFIVGMGASFYTVAQAITVIPLNIAYAIWSGLGTVLTTLIAIVIWREPCNTYTVTGTTLIVIGVILLNLKAIDH